MERYTDLMRFADQIEMLWNEIARFTLSPPDDEFDRDAAISALNAAVQQRLPSIAANCNCTISDLVSNFAPTHQQPFWFYSAHTTSPIETIRQIARFASIQHKDWHG